MEGRRKSRGEEEMRRKHLAIILEISLKPPRYE